MMQAEVGCNTKFFFFVILAGLVKELIHRSCDLKSKTAKKTSLFSSPRFTQQIQMLVSGVPKICAPCMVKVYCILRCLIVDARERNSYSFKMIHYSNEAQDLFLALN